MRVAIDLHIHSALSPCADNEMTPNNIVNMAFIKGLDIIAVTDHNSAENLQAISDCANQRNIVFIPGMEVETREEVHLVCLFPDVQTALKMQDIVYKALPALENREDVFGQQLIMDEEDNIVGQSKRLLITAADLGIDEVFDTVEGLDGVVLPAHIDRDSYSIISNLGIIPDNLKARYLEISRACDGERYKEQNAHLHRFSLLKSSDAHMLEDILERSSFIEVEERSVKGLLNVLRTG
ncbi:MAG: PHP domain-containing protein [Clostridia bacterium]|nr:PHP domain-containing protein [Clostridia bacterium]